jgi:hypothetical protein
MYLSIKKMCDKFKLNQKLTKNSQFLKENKSFKINFEGEIFFLLKTEKN